MDASLLELLPCSLRWEVLQHHQLLKGDVVKSGTAAASKTGFEGAKPATAAATATAATAAVGSHQQQAPIPSFPRHTNWPNTLLPYRDA